MTFTSVGCPLTALEKSLLGRAGEPVYEGSFTANYLRDVLYPAEWEAAVWLTMMGLAAASYVMLLPRRVGKGAPAGQKQPVADCADM